MGTIAAGFVALVLVLGALLTSELGRYGTSDSPSDTQGTALDAPTPSPGAPDDAPPSADPAAPIAPAAPGGTPDGARPSGSPTPSKPVGPPAAGDATNRAVLASINKSLTSMGCDEVTYSATLQKASRAHLASMIRTGYLKLIGPDDSDPGKRARAAGYRRNVLEAIVLGAESPNEAARVGFTKSTDKTVRAQSSGALRCGYRAVGADMALDSRNVPITVIFLGK
ncbi:CAP domain-containing protein [Cryptosporangium arvum]|uniref:CAP domain-containing protein n=1 Tax=Cryptosporangium arvum TaxID=80871 RepID=UPI0012EED3C5|nr:hypothetical protein [Cryptosporangium arvum]